MYTTDGGDSLVVPLRTATSYAEGLVDTGAARDHASEIWLRRRGIEIPRTHAGKSCVR